MNDALPLDAHIVRVWDTRTSWGGNLWRHTSRVRESIRPIDKVIDSGRREHENAEKESI